MSSTAVNDTDFENEVLKADKPVVVDFWAEWCGPCKQLSPVVDELAAEMKDNVKVVKVNIDEAPEAPTKYGVRGVPTLMIFKDGQVAESLVGLRSKEDLSAALQKVL